MRNRISLSVAALLLFALPAAAQDQCVVPYAPTVPDGANATREQIVAARDQVHAFIRDSDSYQRCLTTYLQQQIDAARRDPRDNPPEAVERLRQATANKIGANQREKIRTGTEINAAVKAFNEAHPPAN